jgi:hypothetical protein
MMKPLFFLVVIIFLCACEKKSIENKDIKLEEKQKETVISSVKNSLMSKKINELFDHANLNLQMPFVEKKFAILAMSKNDNLSTYMVDDCQVEFQLTEKENIKAISVFPSEQCYLELDDDFITKENSNTLKIEKLLSIGKKDPDLGNLEVTCPSSCGRTRETEYTVKFFGPTVTGSRRTSYTFRGPDGDFEWLEKVKENLKIDNLDDNLEFKGKDKNFILATDMLKNGYLYKVTFF